MKAQKQLANLAAETYNDEANKEENGFLTFEEVQSRITSPLLSLTRSRLAQCIKDNTNESTKPPHPDETQANDDMIMHCQEVADISQLLEHTHPEDIAAMKGVIRNLSDSYPRTDQFWAIIQKEYGESR